MKINKDAFIILRVDTETKKVIQKKAKQMRMGVSNLIRSILAEVL